jgi:prepilin-type N-terminal cleavage/methylation domain-containing protein
MDELSKSPVYKRDHGLWLPNGCQKLDQAMRGEAKMNSEGKVIRHTVRGFTLIELLVVIAIIADKRQRAPNLL